MKGQRDFIHQLFAVFQLPNQGFKGIVLRKLCLFPDTGHAGERIFQHNNFPWPYAGRGHLGDQSFKVAHRIHLLLEKLPQILILDQKLDDLMSVSNVFGVLQGQ